MPPEPATALPAARLPALQETPAGRRGENAIAWLDHIAAAAFLLPARLRRSRGDGRAREKNGHPGATRPVRLSLFSTTACQYRRLLLGVRFVRIFPDKPGPPGRHVRTRQRTISVVKQRRKNHPIGQRARASPGTGIPRTSDCTNDARQNEPSCWPGTGNLALIASERAA